MASLVASGSWCFGIDRGKEIYDKAFASGGETNEDLNIFLEEVARQLGDSSADFGLVIKLAEHSKLDLSPRMFVAWARGVGRRRGGPGNFGLVERGLLLAPPSFGSHHQVRSALIVVAAHDRSATAVERALTLLKVIRRDGQSPSVEALHGLVGYFGNKPKNSSLFRFGPAHSSLVLIDQIIRDCSVEVTPGLLAQLLRAFVTCGDVIRVFGVLQLMKSKGMAPNLDTYLEVLKGLASAAVPTPTSHELVTDPSGVIDGLLLDMASSNVVFDVKVMNKALRVFLETLHRFEVRLHSAYCPVCIPPPPPRRRPHSVVLEVRL
jgi:hypothetical protein